MGAARPAHHAGVQLIDARSGAVSPMNGSRELTTPSGGK